MNFPSYFCLNFGLPLDDRPEKVDGDWHTREFRKRTVSVNIVTGEVNL